MLEEPKHQKNKIFLKLKYANSHFFPYTIKVKKKKHYCIDEEKN